MSGIPSGDLLDSYRIAAIGQGAAVTKGHKKEMNKTMKQMQEIRQKLRSMGKEDDLLQLFYDQNEYVQVCAATDALEFAEAVAMERLRHLSSTKESWISFTAQMAIQAWENGLRSWNAQDWKNEYQSWEAKFQSPTCQQTQEVDLPEAIEEVKQFLAKVKKIPKTVRFTDIQQLETMEDRFFAVDRTIGTILGMNEDSVDFCPNDKPPNRDEILAWLWIIHPEYKAGILELGNDIVRKAVFESETK
jgi:hypothetical protein